VDWAIGIDFWTQTIVGSDVYQLLRQWPRSNKGFIGFDSGHQRSVYKA
jgi:hypothetical protein